VTIRLTEASIRQAFEQHAQTYNSGRRAWDIGYHVDCWATAAEAFGSNSFAAFERLYRELKGHWQAFRGGGQPAWSASRTWAELRDLPQYLNDTLLSQFRREDAAECWEVLQRISQIKQNRDGPSVVAISKFLHFWNPRLFVIVDRGVMWQYVLAHRWLWRPIDDVRTDLAERLGVERAPIGEACDLLSYAAVLLWGGEVMRANPAIGTQFADHVRRHAGRREAGLPLETYEGAALEWLLLGLVEIAPAGVSF